MNGTNNSKNNNEQKKFVVDPDLDPYQNFKNSSGTPFIILVAHHGGIAVAHLMVSSGAPCATSTWITVAGAPLLTISSGAPLIGKVVRHR
jgi:hypothetical protein